MSQASTSARAPANARAPAKQRGYEPLPGYRLVEPLGHGGYAEVWKCEVPGGIFKAIKFVRGSLDHVADDAQVRQELEALELVKTIRHPFIVSTERVEIIDGELIIVMELVDHNLQDVLTKYQAAGSPGLPRAEVLGYVLEAAEALDLMNRQHGLQHLDIKPSNLFQVGNHVKVADFGLVRTLQRRHSVSQLLPGMTPLYTAPEVLRGEISSFSDQYSLAITYQELLTGTLPFQGKNAREVILKHMTGDPVLDALSENDRPLLARALAKKPGARFGSCLEFAHALWQAEEIQVDVSSQSGSRLTSATLLRLPDTSKTPASKNAPNGTVPSDSPKGKAAAAAPAAGGASCPPLPGFHFLKLLRQSPLAEGWRGHTENGEERVAYLLPRLLASRPDVEERLLKALQTVRHAVLPPCEVYRTPSCRLVVVHEPYESTLADRLAECQKSSLPGIPPEELGNALFAVALALDELAGQGSRGHLGLTPHHLVFRKGRLGIEEFGCIEHIWLAADQPIEQLPSRYAAPELREGRASAACDQYSLALIYTELLTGRPPASKTPAEGAPIDLDPLPAAAREVVSRALEPDPTRRFASCAEFIRALRSATGSASHKLAGEPGVIAVRGSDGHEASERTAPSQESFINHVVRSSAAELCEHAGFQYVRVHGVALEHQAPCTVSLEQVCLPLLQFVCKRGGHVTKAESHLFAAEIPSKQTFWRRWLEGKSGLSLAVEFLAGGDRVALRVGPGQQSQESRELLTQAGPELLHDLREMLGLEAPVEVRLPLVQPVCVYPVFASGELGAAIRGTSVSVASSGIEIRLPAPPGVDQLYVEFPQIQAIADFAVRASLAKCDWRPDGYEAIATFVTPGPSAPPAAPTSSVSA